MAPLLFSADMTDLAIGNTNAFGTEMTEIFFQKIPNCLDTNLFDQNNGTLSKHRQDSGAWGRGGRDGAGRWGGSEEVEIACANKQTSLKYQEA